MQEFEFKFLPDSDHAQTMAEFSTSGFCGGDAGHGGYASLALKMEDSGYGFCVIAVTDSGEMQIDSVRGLTITALGDMEISGFANALISIGEEIKSQLGE